MKKSTKLLPILLIINLIVLTVGVTYKALVAEFDYVFYGLCVVLAVGIAMLIMNLISNKQAKYIQTLENRLEMWNTISYKVKGAGETVFNILPIGVIVLDKKYRVVWSNKKAQEITMNSLQNKDLSYTGNEELLKFVQNNEVAVSEREDFLKEEYVETNMEFYKRIYKVQFAKKNRIIYLTDITDFDILQHNYDERTLAVGFINVDNIDEILYDLDPQTRSDCQRDLLGAIINWSEKFNLYVRAFSESTYIIMSSRKNLKTLMENNFTILDDIKTASSTAYHVSLSIGIACDDAPVIELTERAQENLDLALNRGGDQAVVTNGKEAPKFYGGKTDPIYHEDETDTRKNYEKLEELMLKSSKIFCMGHTNQDADAFGSALAMYKLAKALGKEAYIVLDENRIDDTVSRVYREIEQFHEVLFNAFITPNEAIDKSDANSLLMIVDFQVYTQSFINEGYYKKFGHLGIIDHHRTNNALVIENADFAIRSPGSSSTIELIISLLEYCPCELNIKSFEATCMMLGLVVDTNNFAYRTSSKTFRVAAKLQTYQAQMSLVVDYLKEAKEEKATRSEFINNLEMPYDDIALAFQIDETPHPGPTFAKISDEMLTISNIQLAITAGHGEEKGKHVIRVSARSLGDYNCQVIMERLGGGGHKNAAATRFVDKTLSEVRLLILGVLKDIVESKTELNIIFIKDYKDYKKGSNITLEINKAKQLIQEGYALANKLYYNQAKEEELETIEDDKNAKDDYLRRIKAVLEEKPIEIPVVMMGEHQMKTDVNSKLLNTYFNKILGKFDIKIENKMIDIGEKISNLGQYNVAVKLSDQVIADVIIHVIEVKK